MKLFKAKNIPNMLSILRLLMVPLFVFLFFYEFENHQYWALGVFLLASATDVLDGWLARRFNWVSDLGKIIDPLADKLMQFAACVSLAIKTRYGLMLAIAIFVKDILMTAGGVYLAKEGARDLVVAKWYGKLNTVCLALAVCLLILFYQNETLAAAVTYAALGMMVFTFIMYFSNVFLKFVKRGPEDASALKSDSGEAGQNG
ncbi:MAG: CDP-diacylglycerol--glycerol-3-phosphate 3-phosphatidyltransferase [Clostridia bacterium]|nr:CDP-diacylglycerol--glycerol-3-phosphate 3-phosphatidyltransferase [Clostridia bacterium]